VRRGIEKRAGFVVSDSYMRVSCRGTIIVGDIAEQLTPSV
jgi:hypothetical protein